MKILSTYIQHSKNQLNRPFSYLYSGPKNVEVGFRVYVPFHNQRVMAFVSEVKETNLTPIQLEELNGFRFESIIDVVDTEPLLNPELMQIAQEVADYYMAPKISVLQAMLPPSLKPTASALKGPKIAYDQYVELLDPSEEGLTPKQIELLRLIISSGPILKKECGHPTVLQKLLEEKRVRIFKKERDRLQIPEYEKEQPHELSLSQQAAYDSILNCPQDVVLLQGVTGSGKTEVYLHLSDYYLSKGKTVLMLVPEISLTPVMVEYFSRRFKNNVAILHSELTPAEKYDEYRRIARGEAKIVVGARSAVFAPLTDIGLIILDEEHTESYKQDNLPFYHAREVAILRAKHFGAKAVLGSATPSFETKARAKKGVYGYAELPKRINAQPLPKTQIIDLTNRAIMMPNDRVFSKILIDKLREKLEKKEQAILLINRRGYSSYVSCASCGHIFVCPECKGNLTYHKEDGMLKCHHCGYVDHYPDSCPDCGSTNIMRVGFGTQRVVKVLNEYFPEARIGRLDSDVGKVRNNIAKTLRQFKDKEFDILVGTQMIAKGHDFPNVTLVGLVMADIGLSMPTYRAAERTFELITQAVGRAGRADKTGEALIQTYNPKHYAITLGAQQQYERFYEKDMQERHVSQYPPFTSLIAIEFTAGSEEKAFQAAFDVKRDIERRNFAGVTCLGPIAPYYSVLGHRYKRSLLLKFKNGEEIRPYLQAVLATLAGKGGVDIVYDVDPLDY